jgi:cytochrome P450
VKEVYLIVMAFTYSLKYIVGPTNCAGRALALHEMRTVLVTLVRRFDFAFAPGFEAQDWINQLRDRFLLIRGQLKVLVSFRT